MWWTAAHIRDTVCGTVWNSGDFTTGGPQEGVTGHQRDGGETSDT